MDNDNQTTKEKILECMYHLVAAKGYDKASMSQLCKMVGITKPSLYYYFDSKESIFLAMIDTISYKLELKSLVQIDNKQSYYDYLISLGDTILNGYKDDMERCVLLAEIDIQSARIPEVQEFRMQRSQEMIHLFDCILQHGVNMGAFDKNFDTKHFGQMLYSLTLGFSQAIVHHEDVDAKTIWRKVIKLLVTLEGDFR